MDRSWRKKVEPIGGYSFQAGEEDPAQDEVIFGMDHHLVLILAEVLDQIALSGEAVKGQNRDFFFENSHPNIPLDTGELDALVAIALSLPWCGTLTSSTRFCTSSSRSWTLMNSTFL